MSAFEIIETINSPGTPGKGGDDRFGFDPGAGTAWVLDGATDVTDLTPFPRAESGAAWVAEATSNAFMALSPDEGETARAYFQRALTAVRKRAAGETEIALNRLPGEAWPIASGIWARVAGEEIEFSWMGDCMALDLSTGDFIGPVQAAKDETDELQGKADYTRDQIWAMVREARRQSFDARKPIFGLRPEVVRVPAPVMRPACSGAGFVLMSDGFYRLIEPYRLYDGPGLAEAISNKGLAGLIAELRAFETGAVERSIPRVKSADDACALWLRCF